MTATGPWRRECCYLLEWPAFGRAVEAIAHQIEASATKVDALVAIARGGLVPAGALANLLDVKDVFVCTVSRNVGRGEYLDKADPTIEWFSSLTPLAGRAVLVVDDVIGTGATVDLVHAECENAHAASVRVAAPVVMGAARSKVDFVAHELDDWIVFPWEARPQNRRIVLL